MPFNNVQLSLRDNSLPSTETSEERAVCRILRERKACKLSNLIVELANHMYKNELKHGAWAVGIGLFGPRIFERDARGVVRSMQDRHFFVETVAAS